ncbi:hypothetical protein [Xylophilus sp. GOD-11R]|uniref:hypothetical protein n=1 Tax=Xylophilus sp. GOD-11R TaxID=3089814 RepID=UPI00298BFDEA|nr:hypothetical protein [Xylophilus sp. GOD-11R]WPB57103.1 hypothetical protein R9X41_00095 [Xylophilus sp. GOD-11R]
MFLVLLLVAVLLSAWVFPPDQAARRDAEAGLQRAVATFATARALHAVLSVAQGTEVAVQPAGVGVTLAPGQALQPVTELVEQFSTLMLAACVAFGVELLLLPITAHWAMSAAVSVAALAWVLLQGFGRPQARRLAPLLVGLMLLRFGVPLMAAGNELAWRAFLADDYAAAQSAIGGAAGSADLVTVPDTPATGQKSWFDTVRELPASVGAWTARVPEIASRARDIAAHAVDHLLRLLAVFLVQTLVLPLLFLWGLKRIFALLVDSAGRPVR